MFAPVQYVFNASNFLDKGQTNKNFLIQINKCHHKLKI